MLMIALMLKKSHVHACQIIGPHHQVLINQQHGYRGNAGAIDPSQRNLLTK